MQKRTIPKSAEWVERPDENERSSSLPPDGGGIIRSKIFGHYVSKNKGSLKRWSNYPRRSDIEVNYTIRSGAGYPTGEAMWGLYS